VVSPAGRRRTAGRAGRQAAPGEGTHSGRFLGLEPTGRRVWWEFADLYRLGADGRLNWHFFVTDWNFVRLQLLGEEPGLPAPPERRAVMAG